MIRKQIYLVHIEDMAVRFREQRPAGDTPARLQRRLYVDGSNQAILGDVEGAFDNTHAAGKRPGSADQG